jgi:RNA polymerase-interacting CarD/CdnL/TRCF family regulator
MLDTARNLLVKELSIAEQIPENNIEDHIKVIFNA